MLNRLKLLQNNRTNKYCMWMAVNSWSGSVNGVISTNTMLGAIGVSQSATNNVTATYIGKDVIGQLGGLVYAWKTGQKADRTPKSYITRGSVIQNTAYFVENASSLVPKEMLLPVLGSSSFLKNLSWVSIGAVNARNLSKLTGNKMGEVYSKVAAINTLSSTAGMLCGLGLIKLCPSYTLRSIMIMPVMSGINIYSARKATEIASQK